MGMYVTFSMGAEDGIASHLLSAPLDRFEAWVLTTLEEFPYEFQEGLPATVRDLRARGREALVATDPASAARVDHLLDVFYGHYCDYVEGKLMPPADVAMLPVRYFEEATGILQGSLRDTGLLQLWQYLFEGRAVLRDPEVLPYMPSEAVLRLSYWTAPECMSLHREIGRIARPGRDTPGEHALSSALRALSKALGAKTGLINTMA